MTVGLSTVQIVISVVSMTGIAETTTGMGSYIWSGLDPNGPVDEWRRRKKHDFRRCLSHRDDAPRRHECRDSNTGGSSVVTISMSSLAVATTIFGGSTGIVTTLPGGTSLVMVAPGGSSVVTLSASASPVVTTIYGGSSGVTETLPGGTSVLTIPAGGSSVVSLSLQW